MIPPTTTTPTYTPHIPSPPTPIRTPSPTPSERYELENDSRGFSIKSLLMDKEMNLQKKIVYLIIIVIIVVLVVLMLVYHDQIIHWLQPAADWLKKQPAGWLVPIAILFVISFPPLFGHEIVAVLCGLVWGLGPGFGIVAAGTFLGEVGNFYAFKYLCKSRAEKMEKNKIGFACLARVIRDGGIWIALVARYSAIPGHFTTAIFATCGMNIWVFCIAAILSLPKQFATVYLGVALEQSADGERKTKDKVASDIVIAVTVIVTVVAMRFISYRIKKVKPQVIYERRKARQQKLIQEAEHSDDPYRFSNDALLAPSDSHIPLNPMNQTPIYAPQPVSYAQVP